MSILTFDDSGFDAGAHRIGWHDLVTVGIRTTADGPFAEVEFEYAVEEEYGTIPTAAFRRARGRFLAGLLEQPIYRTAPFGERFEAAARANIGALLRSRRYAAYRWLRWLPPRPRST